MAHLRKLRHAAVSKMTADFRLGIEEATFTEFVEPLPRRVDLDSLDVLLEETMKRFEEDRGGSDSWLAPRLHAALKITRREGADKGIWSYLALVEFPHYVRWRFASDSEEGTPAERFVGPHYKQALARLWWGAELTRNGSSYAPVVKLFQIQDLQNTWMHYRAMHNRAAAIAAVSFLSTFRDGSVATGDQINELGPALNFALTTTVLDAVAPDPGVDALAAANWVSARVGEADLFSDALPDGPDDEPVDPVSIAAVEALLRRLALDIDLEHVSRARRRTRTRLRSAARQTEQ